MLLMPLNETMRSNIPGHAAQLPRSGPQSGVFLLVQRILVTRFGPGIETVPGKSLATITVCLGT